MLGGQKKSKTVTKCSPGKRQKGDPKSLGIRGERGEKKLQKEKKITNERKNRQRVEKKATGTGGQKPWWEPSGQKEHLGKKNGTGCRSLCHERKFAGTVGLGEEGEFQTTGRKVNKGTRGEPTTWGLKGEMVGGLGFGRARPQDWENVPPNVGRSKKPS